MVVQILTTIHSPFYCQDILIKYFIEIFNRDRAWEIKVYFILNKISVVYQKIRQDDLEELKCQFVWRKPFKSDK